MKYAILAAVSALALYAPGAAAQSCPSGTSSCSIQNTEIGDTTASAANTTSVSAMAGNSTASNASGVTISPNIDNTAQQTATTITGAIGSHGNQLSNDNRSQASNGNQTMGQANTGYVGPISNNSSTGPVSVGPVTTGPSTSSATGGNSTANGGAVLASGNSANDIRNSATGGEGGAALAVGGQGGASLAGAVGNTGEISGGSVGDTISVSEGGAVGDTTSASFSRGGSADNSNNADNSSRNEASGNSVSVQGDTHNYRRSAPPAIAPTMISQCGAAISGAGSGSSFGAALGVPIGVQTCQRVQLATQMAALNKVGAACEIMRQDKRVRRAMEEAGETCEYVAPVQTETVYVEVPTAREPTDRERLDAMTFPEPREARN